MKKIAAKRSVGDLMRLDGRVALVTGGAGHLGRVIVDTLAELGASIAVADLAADACAGVAAGAADAYGGRAAGFAVNLESEREVKALPKRVAKALGGVDILIHSAALVGSSTLTGWAVPFPRQEDAAWRRALEVNITSFFTLTRESASFLGKSGRGAVISIGSIYGVVGPDFGLYKGTAMGNPAAYAASKGGLVQLTRYLATALAPSIRVNCLSCGGIERGQPPAFQRRYKARTPLRRMATEGDFKGTIAYLASDLSAYVTGQNILVDGGFTAW